MKTIKVKATGVVTEVSDEYFKTYENGGWFIEVMPEPKKLTVSKKDTAKES